MESGSNKVPFTKAYLKGYEKKIRRLSLEELYDILGTIEMDPFRKDKTPERINIVKKRIRQLENFVQTYEKEKTFETKIKEEYQKRRTPLVILMEYAAWIFAFAGLLKISNGKKSTEPTDFRSEALLIGAFLFLEACVGLKTRAVTVKGGRIYEAKNPFYYRIVMFSYFAISVGCFAYALLSFTGIVQ